MPSTRLTMKSQSLQLLTLIWYSYSSNGEPVLEFNSNSISEGTANLWQNEGTFSSIPSISLTDFTIANKGTNSIKSVCFESDTCLRVDYDISPSQHSSLTMELYAYQLSLPSNHPAWVMSQDPGHYGRSIMESYRCGMECRWQCDVICQ
eukprot:423140_1